MKRVFIGALVLTLLGISARPSLAAPSLESRPFPYCSWWVETSTTNSNTAEPDTNAAYWTTPFDVSQGAITISGAFPSSRYMSLQVYNHKGELVEVLDPATRQLTTAYSSLADFQLVPDEGQDNPYVTGDYPASPVSYTVSLVPYIGGRPTVRGLTNTLPLPQPIPGDPASNLGFVILRTYVPSPAVVSQSLLPPTATPYPASSIPSAFNLERQALPQIFMGTTTDESGALPACRADDQAQLLGAPKTAMEKEAATLLLESLSGLTYQRNEIAEGTTLSADVASGLGAHLTFVKTYSQTTPFPNGDSAYVAATYGLRPGQAVVMAMNLPTSPWNLAPPGTAVTMPSENTWPTGSVPAAWGDGEPSQYQLRYFSVCSYVNAPPFPVADVQDGCATDTDIRAADATSPAAPPKSRQPSRDPSLASNRSLLSHVSFLSPTSERPTSITAGGSVVIVTFPGEKLVPTWRTGPFTWLPARRANASSIQSIALRNMLPSTAFAQSATNVEYPTSVTDFSPDSNAALAREVLTTMASATASTMGEYYPEAYICDVDTLAAVGPVLCIREATQEKACKLALLERNGNKGALIKDRAVRQCLMALKSGTKSHAGFTVLKGCILRASTSCVHHDLSQSSLRNTVLRGAMLSRTRMASSNLSGAVLERAILRHSSMPKATLDQAQAALADLTAANLAGVSAQRADLSDAVLIRASLRGANFQSADLTGADLRGADLRNVDFTGASLAGADLRGADVRGADFTDASLKGAVVDPGTLISRPAVIIDQSPSPVAPSRNLPINSGP